MSVDNDFEPTPCLNSDSFTTTAEDHQAAHSAKSDLKTDTVSNARSPTNRTTALPGRTHDWILRVRTQEGQGQ